MIKADEVSFPPTSTDDLLYFIAQELIIVKNIPITLSSDTIYNYLSTYGPIKCFKTVSTKSDRQEALVLFNDPDTAQNVLNLNINGIGGFYLAKCDIKKHSYILSIDKMPIYSEWDENLVDLDVESNTEQKEPPMSVELLINYAHVFATLYIAIEYLSNFFGIPKLLERINFSEILARLNEQFDLQSKWSSIHRTAHIVKEQVGQGSIGRPLVQQYEEMKYCAREMKEHTKRIIASKKHRLKREEMYDKKYFSSRKGML